MKMLFITDLYPVKDDEKTTPKTLLNFVHGFELENIQVDVIKPNFILNSFLRQKPFYKSGQYGKILNLNYHTPFLGNVLKKTEKFSDWDFSDVSLIVSHMPSGSIFACKLARKLDLALVCGVHMSDLEVLTNPLYSVYFKKSLLNAFIEAKLLACRSFVIKNRLLELYPEFESKTFVAASGIDEDIIIDRRDKKFGSKIKVLTCANFKKRKNIDKVINALKNHSDFELTVIGDGPGRKYLQNIDKTVKFMGALEHNEVLKIMSQNDIFILPSVGETFGMVYLEAMASGCVTVGVENDGIDGIIKNNENGFLIKPEVKNIYEILLKIKNMDDNSLKLLRSNAFDTIKHYTAKTMCQYYLQQIFKIL